MAVAPLLSRRFFKKPFPLFSFHSSFSISSWPPPPPPIRVALTESVGRAVFATRPIAAGDLIHTATPAVCHPSSAHAACYTCLAALPHSQPHRVSIPFCSQHCHQRSKGYYDVEMKANWVAFNHYCWTHGLKYPFLVKRLACMVISGDARSDTLDILQPANLTPEMVLEMEEEFVLLRNAFTKALIADEHIAFLTKQWYIDILARIRINAFRIELAGGLYEDLLASAVASVEAEAAVGNAVYILPSFYNHDCDPNAHIIWIDNADAKLKALRDIDEGEELRICYIDASLDRDARRELLFRELSLGESHDSVDDSAAEDYSDPEEDCHSSAEKHVSATTENYDLVFGNFQHSGNSILDAMPLEPAIPIKPESDGLTIKIGEITCFLVVDTANGKSNDSATKQEEKEMETEIDVAEDDQYEHETTKEFIRDRNSSTATADLVFEITEKSKKVITNLLEKVDQVDPNPIDLVPRHQHHQVPLFSAFPLSPTTTSSTSSPPFAFGIGKCRFVATMAEFLCYNIYIFDPGGFSILRLRAVTFGVLDDERRCGRNHHGLHLHVESRTVPLLIPPLRILKLIIDLRIATPLENSESETCHCRSCCPKCYCKAPCNASPHSPICFLVIEGAPIEENYNCARLHCWLKHPNSPWAGLGFK